MAMILDYWNQYTAVLMVCALLLSYRFVLPNFGLPASLLFASCAYSSITTWVYVPNRYVFIEPYNQMALRYFSCDSLAKMFIILMPLMILSEKRYSFRAIGEFLAVGYAVMNSIVCLWEARNGCSGLTCGGLMGNPSISMGFMAATLPIFIRSWKQWPYMLLTGAAILVSKSSVSLGLYAIFACYLSWVSARKYALLPAFASFLAIMGIGRISLGAELANDSDRFMIWKYMLNAWNVPWNWAFGTGLGTYHVLSINLQNAGGHHVASGYWWLTLHNDFLQMLFECGGVGLALLVATFGAAIYKLYIEDDWPMLVSILLFGIYMTLDPALHNPIPEIFGAWAFVYALRRQPKEIP